MQRRDRIFKWICAGCALCIGLLVPGIFLQLGLHSAEAWREFGVGFLWSSDWEPAQELLGLALLLAEPLSFVGALFVVEDPGRLFSLNQLSQFFTNDGCSA